MQNKSKRNGICALVEGIDEEYQSVGELLVHNDVRLEDADPVWTGSRFLRNQTKLFSTTKIESIIVRRHILRMLNNNGVQEDDTVLDLGSADGRIVRFLLDAGFKSIIANDLDHSGMAAMLSNLDECEKRSVLGIVGDVTRIRLQTASVKCIIAWGIFSLTPDYLSALRHTLKWLRNDGCLIIAEPLLEQALQYCLVRKDIEEYARTLQTQTRYKSWDNRDDRYPVRPYGYYEKLFAGLDLCLMETGGISSLPSLFFGGLCQDTEFSDETMNLMRNLMIEQVELFEQHRDWRQAFWLFRKAN